mmetsp:Transcript_5165/g.7910  ORF Transcript_5165/g.7910 Transcript_5165/m.7910 type:complete len:316 (+) Transcript_5165:74-1021(+)|eukprot:CAMPEP_0185019524 /NCGR_PEP_ID=MMETSP1103-20130426/2137_1 /TAXON_ID=36769 /ORGANISM="Paraphysomonas bandaiensis, Strain Caron Lab Isolate" /LENGTH=315 /DNA_ID=CAMNT_0027549893 /DNA_START=43 /DNA_END=990 /DNA_ORIENTATION=-
MPVIIPPELKPISPYIRRAEELERDTSNPDHKDIAYFCRAYAMEKAMELRAQCSSGDVDQFLMTLMTELENTKASLPPGLSSRGKPLCESFALSLFTRADEEDRAGVANKETARMFYNASSFFDILKQFGDVDEEMENKNKYCKWKATDIMKALKEGRKPTPGGYGEDGTGESGSTASGSESTPIEVDPPNFPPSAPTHNPNERLSLDAIPRAPGQISPVPQNISAPSQANDIPFCPPPTQQPQFPQYTPPASNSSTFSANTGVTTYKPPPKANNMDIKSKDALELCAFAMTALKHKELELAKDRLREALKRLGD